MLVLTSVRVKKESGRASFHAEKKLRTGQSFFLWMLWLGLLLSWPAAASPLQPELEALQAFEQAQTEIKARRGDRAEILLERVLMLQPEHAEARIELALLLYARGQQESSRALIQSLIDDPRAEADQIRELRKLLTLIRADRPQQHGINNDNPTADPTSPSPPVQRATRTPTWRAEVNLSQSTNPLARTSAKAIAITLPDGPLVLPLSEFQRSGSLTGAHLSRTTERGGAELDFQGTNVSDSGLAARAIVWGRVSLTSWKNNKQPTLLAFAQAQRGLDGQRRTLLGLNANSGSQKYTLLKYNDLSVGDSGLIWRIEHQPSKIWGTEWQALLERSNSTKGPQGHWRFGLTGEYPFNDRSKLQVQWSLQKDSYAYNQFLNSGAKRQLETTHVAYEQRHYLNHEKTLIWRVFTGERRSNLLLFDYKDSGLQIGITKKWP